jgi:hypothetical protein
MVSTPYIATVPLTTLVGPGASVGTNLTDTATFWGTGNSLATKMVANNYYAINQLGGVNFGTYGTLQTNQGTGIANTIGAVYLASGPATLVAGSTGASASFANNAAGIGVMTLTVAATGGLTYPIVGQVVSSAGLTGSFLVVGIISGANNAVGSTYLLSGATGTVGAAAITLSQGSFVDPLPVSQASSLNPYTPNPIMVNPATTPLAAYAAGTAAYSTAAMAQALYLQVQAINAALLAIGIIA